jgi:poly(3-hydroxybutyrate) depolymerase
VGVPLVDQPLRAVESDHSSRRLVEFVSPADGSPQRADVYAPEGLEAPAPVVLAPHPITWTAAQDYHGGLAGSKRGHHRGWRGLAAKYGVIVVMPHGHHRRVERCSLAGPEQIADMAFLVGELNDAGYPVDRSRVYACGLSMGGLEALVAVGRHPELFAAVAVFNPIVDLGAWHDDLERTPVAEIREFGTAAKIVEEVGGLPTAELSAYAERSATSYLDGLGQVPTLLFWSALDLIVPRQETHHAYRLYRELKRLGAARPACEYEHTASHALTRVNETIRWQLHEWCDYDLALHWLLAHRKPLTKPDPKESR